MMRTGQNNNVDFVVVFYVCHFDSSFITLSRSSCYPLHSMYSNLTYYLGSKEMRFQWLEFLFSRVLDSHRLGVMDFPKLISIHCYPVYTFAFKKLFSNCVLQANTNIHFYSTTSFCSVHLWFCLLNKNIIWLNMFSKKK